jgi:ribonuclease T1
MPNAGLLKGWLFLLIALLLSLQAWSKEVSRIGEVDLENLPREARATLARIKRGGPFPYTKDGIVFGNYEGVLPRQKRGYYHEFTVKTPGMRSRGARRIIAGGEPAISGEYYYTDDHYATFRRIKE